MYTISMIIALAAAVISIIYGLVLVVAVSKKDQGNKKMVDIAKAIQEGAMAFLNRQYSTVGVVAAVLFVILLYALGWKIAVGFLVGAAFSALAGYIGMNVSVRGNVRTAEAAKKGLPAGMDVAFKSGTVTGLLVVGLALLSVTGYYALTKDIEALIGLGFGGSLISIFGLFCCV